MWPLVLGCSDFLGRPGVAGNLWLVQAAGSRHLAACRKCSGCKLAAVIAVLWQAGRSAEGLCWRSEGQKHSCRHPLDLHQIRAN